MKTLYKYLGWTFGIAWVIMIEVAIFSKLAEKGGGVSTIFIILAQLLSSLVMFVPLFGVILSGAKLEGMGWKPVFKGNILTLIFSWFVPAVLTLLGAALFFAFFPDLLDLTGKALTEATSEEALKQLEAAGLSYSLYIIIGVISAITYAPLINMFFAVGEEAGWRGFMYPVLKERFGREKGMILGGIIWGMWHWPLIMLTGYEYGTNYRGFPTAGMAVFCVFTVAFGILCNYVYEKSGCIWYPAILHGSVNAVATLPGLVINSSAGSTRLLGPYINGLIAGIPLVVLAVLVLVLTKNKKKSI